MKAETRHAAPPKPPTTPQPTRAPSRSGDNDSDKGKPASLTSPRRSDIERTRSSWSTRGAEAMPTADGQYFAQLIGLVDEGGGQQGWGGGAIALAVQNEDVPMDLMDELAQRLSKDPTSALNVTLLMPNLGRIEVRATPQNGRWDIELGFARREVLKRLRPRQHACEAALTEALGQPVALSMLDEACI